MTNTDSLNKPDSMAEDELRETIKQRILTFMAGNLHVLLIDSIETDGDTIPIPREKFAGDLSKQMEDVINTYTTNKIIEELERLQKLHTRTYRQTVTDNTGGVYVDDTHSYISKYETQERIAELKALNHRSKR